MTIDEQIAAKRKEIDTIDFIAARCTTDGQYRVYAENRNQRVKELVELQRQKKEAEGGQAQSPCAG